MYSPRISVSLTYSLIPDGSITPQAASVFIVTQRGLGHAWAMHGPREMGVAHVGMCNIINL